MLRRNFGASIAERPDPELWGIGGSKSWKSLMSSAAGKAEASDPSAPIVRTGHRVKCPAIQPAVMITDYR
jgi:hypothetical protein